MNVRELKDSAGTVFSPKVSTESVYLKGSETNLDSKLSSMDNTISGKMNNVSLATVATSGSYNDLNSKPTIPTRTSQLTNDSGFITSGNIPLVASNSPIWVQGGSAAGGNTNRLTTNGGMPADMQYNSGVRGTKIFSNGICFCDPYNGSSNNDGAWIRHIEESVNEGYLEIAVGDDASNESIVVRRYNTSNQVAQQINLFDSNGNTYFPGSVTSPGFYVSSSRTVKENIKPTTINGEDMVNSIDVVDFTYKTDEKHNPKIGFIAEDTDPLLSTPEQKTMDFSNCIGVMMKAIQELSAKVKTLTDKLESLTPPLFKLIIHRKLPSIIINSKLILKEVA